MSSQTETFNSTGTSIGTIVSKPKAPEIEHRTYAIDDLEIRAEKNDDGSITMSGYAAVFESRSVVMWDWSVGSFVEEVSRGAFTKTIKEADVRLLINHDPNLILARTRAETLDLAEDHHGLRVEARMAPTSYAEDLAVSMRRGDISQMSFAFRTIKDEWAETEDSMPLRRLLEVALSDASVVTYPAYPATEAAAHSVELRAIISALGLDEIDDDERNKFIHDLIHNEIRHEGLPVLQVARKALDARIAAVEPHEQHSTEPMDIYARRYRALAALHGFAEVAD